MPIPCALLLALSLSAQSAPVPVPETLRRNELPPEEKHLPGIPALDDALPWKSVLKIAKKRELDLEKISAIEAMRERISILSKSPPFERIESDSLKFLEEQFADRSQPEFRRFAVSQIFGAAVGSVRGYIELHPDKRHSRTAWKKLTKLRDRGLNDPDKRLSEFFERYLPYTPSPPDWEGVKKMNHDLIALAIALNPEIKEKANAVWYDCHSFEAAQQDLRKRTLVRIQNNPRWSKNADFIQQAESTYDHRLYLIWGNVFPRKLQKALGEDEFSKTRMEFPPVKLGWPDF